MEQMGCGQASPFRWGIEQGGRPCGGWGLCGGGGVPEPQGRSGFALRAVHILSLSLLISLSLSLLVLSRDFVPVLVTVLCSCLTHCSHLAWDFPLISPSLLLGIHPPEVPPPHPHPDRERPPGARRVNSKYLGLTEQ